MSFLTFIVQNAISIYVWALLMRVWMQWVRCDYYNPFAQTIVRITQPVIKPFRRFIPSIGPIDTATLVVALILSILKAPILMLISGQSLALEGAIVDLAIIGIAVFFKLAGNLLFWTLVLRVIMSWISRGRGLIDQLIYQLTEPLMAPIRRIIPPLMGLDFSVMVLLFGLSALNYLGYDIFGPIWAYL
jgi:YggT family protein